MRKSGVLRRERGHLSGVDDLERRECKRQRQTVLGHSDSTRGTSTDCSMGSFDEI